MIQALRTIFEDIFWEGCCCLVFIRLGRISSRWLTWLFGPRFMAIWPIANLSQWHEVLLGKESRISEPLKELSNWKCKHPTNVFLSILLHGFLTFREALYFRNSMCFDPKSNQQGSSYENPKSFGCKILQSTYTCA